MALMCSVQYVEGEGKLSLLILEEWLKSVISGSNLKAHWRDKTVNFTVKINKIAEYSKSNQKFNSLYWVIKLVKPQKQCKEK